MHSLFPQYLKQYITNMTPDLFNELIQHLSRCGAAYRMAAILEARRDVLSHLFNDCDHAGVGVIDRHRVLGLFEYFWDNQPWAVKRYLQNPRKCKLAYPLKGTFIYCLWCMELFD